MQLKLLPQGIAAWNNMYTVGNCNRILVINMIDCCSWYGTWLSIGWCCWLRGGCGWQIWMWMWWLCTDFPANHKCIAGSRDRWEFKLFFRGPVGSLYHCPTDRKKRSAVMAVQGHCEILNHYEEVLYTWNNEVNAWQISRYKYHMANITWQILYDKCHVTNLAWQINIHGCRVLSYAVVW